MDSVINGPTKSDIVGALLFDRDKILEFELVGKGKVGMKLKGLVPAKDKGQDLLIVSTRKIPGDCDRHGFLLYNMEERSGTFVDPKTMVELEAMLQR